MDDFGAVLALALALTFQQLGDLGFQAHGDGHEADPGDDDDGTLYYACITASVAPNLGAGYSSARSSPFTELAQANGGCQTW